MSIGCGFWFSSPSILQYLFWKGKESYELICLFSADNILPPSNITVQSGPPGIGYSLFLSWQTLVGQRWNLTAVACNAAEVCVQSITI